MSRTYYWFEVVFWTGVALLLAASMVAFAVRPEPRTFYGADTGLCDSGCSDFR